MFANEIGGTFLWWNFPCNITSSGCDTGLVPGIRETTGRTRLNALRMHPDSVLDIETLVDTGINPAMKVVFILSRHARAVCFVNGTI